MLRLFSNKSPKGEVSTLVLGQEVTVGRFFWIETCIGFADNARHGHDSFNKKMPGSADVDCKVRILRVDGDFATVVLLRPEMPYGAPAPHGTIFVLPTEEILGWSEMTKDRLRKDKLRDSFRRSLGRVVI